MLSARIRTLVLVGVVGALVAGGAVGAEAGPRPLRLNVDIGTAGGLSPDRRSVGVGVLARCPAGWTVVKTSVSISQGRASGAGSFPLTCTDEYQSFQLTLQSTAAPFELGDAQGSASVTISRGKTEQVTDSNVVGLEPTVVARLADTALLGSGGRTVRINVTVACTPGPTPLESNVNVSSQGLVSGNGVYLPECDGQAHTFTVKVQAHEGIFRPGGAQALTFAVTELEGVGFYGIDERTIQIVTA
jgi:hypothetical protein